MEFLAPSYRLLLQIRYRMGSGVAVHEALRQSLPCEDGEFERALRRWWQARERGARPRPRDHFLPPLQRVFVETLERGMNGEPILERLGEIEEEMRTNMQDTVERHLQRLPVILLLPLTFLVFPAFLLQLLGPLLSEVLRSLK